MTDAMPGGLDSVVVGGRDQSDERVPFLVDDVGANTLLKLHGSVDRSGSLAFTDLELLTPFKPVEIDHLAALADDCRLVVYGYRGADADLHSLMKETLERAHEVRWYEPSEAVRADILQAFPNSPITFDPPELSGSDFSSNLSLTAQRFIDEAVDAGLLDPVRDSLLASQLGSQGEFLWLSFDFPDLPVIVDARLVERFGRTQDVDQALRVARHADLLRLPPRAIREHVHWTLSRSLYKERGVVHRIVRALAMRPRMAKHLPSRLRGYVFDKGPAVLLPEGRYREIHKMVREADTLPERRTRLRRGSDRYYDAHALRYLNRPADARAALDEAADLLRGDRDQETASDAERYAGVILEQGEIALYQGRIHDAFVASHDLVNGPGRYAIGRWSGWGHWLWAMADLYSVGLADGELDSLERAEMHLAKADEDFADADLDRGAGDVFVARSLLARLRLALEDVGTLDSFDSDVGVPLTKRQSQDHLLLRADFAIGVGELEIAARCLDEVERSPSSEVTLSWSTLGRAEIARRFGRGQGPDLMAVRDDAIDRGAWWLAAQAELGMTEADEARVQTPDGTVVRALGRPRVLWMTT